MSAPHLTSSEEEAVATFAEGFVNKAPSASTTSVRDSVLLARDALSDHRANNTAFQKALDASLDDITSKLNRMSALVSREGSDPTNAVTGTNDAHLDSISLMALGEELEKLREASKAQKIRAGFCQAKLESSLRDLEVKLDNAGTSGGENVIVDPASKVSAPSLNMWISVAKFSASTPEVAVAYVAASELSCYPYLIHSPLTLLELAYEWEMSPNPDVLAQMCLERELGMERAECAHQVAFRRFGIPTVFGTGEEWYKLSAIPTPKDFRANTFPDPSLSHHLETAVRDARRCVDEMIRSAHLSPSVKGLLTEMLELSQRFIEALLSFMWDSYCRFVRSPLLSEEDSWELVQRLTWELFDDLSECHVHASGVVFGSACRTAQTTGKVLWSTLQMHKVMATYRKSTRWEKHPTLTPLVTEFLLLKSASRRDVDKISREVEALREELASLRASNPVASQSNPTRQARRRRRRGGRNEAEGVGETHVRDDADSAQDDDCSEQDT